jgi:hypothetical protein
MAARHSGKQSHTFRTNLELVERVREIADEKGLTPSKLAIAWVLSRGEDIVSLRHDYRGTSDRGAGGFLSEDGPIAPPPIRSR